TVTPPAGSNLPDAVRLNFTLTFSVPRSIPYAGLTVNDNGTQLGYSYSDPVLYLGPGIRSDPSNGAVVDSTAVSFDPGRNLVTLKDTFHLDLPLDRSGLSSPFNLGLHLSPFMGMTSNGSTRYSDLAANLALTGLTLTDGTPLAPTGDSVAFASGLASANPVPEPASLLAWGLIAATSGAVTVRRSRSAHGCR
ncbi:MAG: hypothetical protein LC745_11225, partial [Planctomycetia bacterium]|nr:hypothetical protein [Planctomycetia bacterium]